MIFMGSTAHVPRLSYPFALFDALQWEKGRWRVVDYRYVARFVEFCGTYTVAAREYSGRASRSRVPLASNRRYTVKYQGALTKLADRVVKWYSVLKKRTRKMSMSRKVSKYFRKNANIHNQPSSPALFVDGKGGL